MADTTAKSPAAGNGAIDTGAQRVGKLYAKAFLGAAEKAGQTDAVVEELDAVVTEALDPYPRFESLLASGMLSPAEAEGVLQRTLGPWVSPLLMNFLKVLATRGRLDCLRAIRQAAHDQLDQMRGRARVTVSTATPLPADALSKLGTRLRGMLALEPVLEPQVDPDLIGGVLLRVGDTVYDGSVATRLAQVREQMINRSVHEIQSRRDRFGDPAGN
ncbi:MAG: ATP synthase F1 subunit delta [Pirellulales bacterium]|nr:ATP synthase F1 subunit delta [Pirellulales bacterium]